MAKSYLQTCILDALAKAKGNETKARQIISSQALEDDQLLLALAKPHLSGIVAHAVGRISIQEQKKKNAAQAMIFRQYPRRPNQVKTKMRLALICSRR